MNTKQNNGNKSKSYHNKKKAATHSEYLLIWNHVFSVFVSDFLFVMEFDGIKTTMLHQQQNKV